jgi:hypothetical protein
LDGTGAIVIGMVLLWQRLAAGHPTRAHIAQFLTSPESPLACLTHRLSHTYEPLIAGSGEFGGGVGIRGE